jgi:hypothetical protein
MNNLAENPDEHCKLKLNSTSVDWGTNCILFILVSKPKLRRIEKKIVPVIQRLTKEDLMKSSMYQQFISVMEKIFEQLDETDGPINLGKKQNKTAPLTSIFNT